MQVTIQLEKISNKLDDIVIIDIHGDTLYETRTNLPSLIVDHIVMDYEYFEIIHGYSQGRVLMDYVRNLLVNDINKLKGNIKYQMIKCNKGATRLYCKF